jgi:hypothetical protein
LESLNLEKSNWPNGTIHQTVTGQARGPLPASSIYKNIRGIKINKIVCRQS